jgi:hypothetical protein
MAPYPSRTIGGSPPIASSPPAHAGCVSRPVMPQTPWSRSLRSTSS